MSFLFVGGTAHAEGHEQNPKASDEKTEASDEKGEGSGEETADSGEKPSGMKRGLLGADLLFVLPVGDMADLTGPLLGPMLRLGERFSQSVELAGRIGYLAAFNKSQTGSSGPVTASGDQSITDFPIWLGAHFFYPGEGDGFYVLGELAFNFLIAHASATVASGGQQASASSNETHARAGFNAGIGYLLSRKVPLDIAVQFSYFNLAFVDSDSETKLLGVGFSVGYSMAL